MKDEQVFVYVGLNDCCQKVVAAAADLPKVKDETAKFVSKMIRDGLIVKRISIQEYRGLSWCDCPPKTEAEKQTAVGA